MFAGGLVQIVVFFFFVVAIPLVLALMLARARQTIAVWILLILLVSSAVWFYLQIEGMTAPIMDRTSVSYLFIFVVMPALISGILGAVIGWLLARRKTSS